MRQDEFQRRADSNYEKCGWTEEQREFFDKFNNERYANTRKPENTSLSLFKEREVHSFSGASCSFSMQMLGAE
jgi:hypothetical protein